LAELVAQAVDNKIVKPAKSPTPMKAIISKSAKRCWNYELRFWTLAKTTKT